MKILIACEFSGIVRNAFSKLGHDAWSCDLLPTEQSGNHLQCDVFDIIHNGWDIMIAHPPCTYLAVCGNRWMNPERKKLQEKAIEFVRKLMDSNINKIAIENPVGVLSTNIRKPDQYIQPYWFGDPERKKTGLWLKNLQKLNPTNIVEPNIIIHKNGKTDSKWHYESISFTKQERSKYRSRTFKGIANAMANQWGNL